MDDKTAELRDLFVEVTDEEEVTESQAETPGTLVSDRDRDEELRGVIADMREHLGFETDLSDRALVAVVRGFYAGDPDAAIAERLDGADADDVARARLDLHLLRDADAEVPFDAAAVREALDDGRSPADVAATVDADEAAVRRFERVVAARREMLTVNRRYRDQFESRIEDGALAERMTGDLATDPLAGATEGQEVDVDF